MNRRFQCQFRFEGDNAPHSPVVIQARDVAEAARKLQCFVDPVCPLLTITECTIKAA